MVAVSTTATAADATIAVRVRAETPFAMVPSTRQDANLSAIIGQSALMAAIQTMQALGNAREGIVDTHRQLSVAQRDIGLSAVSFGNAGDKPPSPERLGSLENSRLEVVASDRTAA